ncbi:P-loop NTPase [Bradyrhizobium sp. USDA 4353]
MNMRFVDFPPELERFRLLAENAFDSWAPGSEIAYRRLKQGFSGAAVVRADVRTQNATTDLRSGEYIVKFSEPIKWDDQESEDVCHARAQNFSPRFAKKHIPLLLKVRKVEEFTSEQIEAARGEFSASQETAYLPGYAALYEIAGGSLSRFAPLDRLDADYFSKTVANISKDLAVSWSKPNPDRQLTVAELLVDWLGYRLDHESNAGFRKFIAEQTHSTRRYSYGNRYLIDPLYFYQICSREINSKIYVVDGLLHGDLHKGNILVHQRDPADQPYWIIDFALSRLGPIGFDQAYLEVGCLIEQAVTLPAVEYLDLLDAIFREDNIFQLHSTSARQLGEAICSIRSGLSAWSDSAQRYRKDHITQQLQLSRIAAGMNWANKSGLDTAKRLAALAYSSLAAEQFLKENFRSVYQKIWTELEVSGADSTSIRSGLSQADHELWKQLVAASNHFDSSSNRYALVVDPIPSESIPQTLGPGVWSAIFDLDPHSDDSGLYQRVGRSLELSRGVHIFDDEFPSLDFRHGTAWMMAGGWAEKRKLFESDQEWKYQQRKTILRFSEFLIQSTAPSPLFVFIVANDRGNRYRLKQIVEAIDYASDGSAYFILIGGAKESEFDIRHGVEIPLSAANFFNLLERHTVGALFSDEPDLPAADGSRIAVPYEKLRVIEENLSVLHSKILLDDGTQENLAAGAFWRGRPVSWRELDAGMDVTRAVHAELMDTLRRKLDSYSTETQLLFHTPGAGGTTVAYRAAWDLHNEYPTAILRSATRGLADRIRELFQLTQKPVLIVAESTVLTENHREELYRSLRQSNCRAVILYVRKIIENGKTRAGFVVPDPMLSEECLLFERSYASLVSDDTIKVKLRQVSVDKAYERYRIPFFFGLIAFERDFTSVDRFVDTHLHGVRGRVAETIELLSFVTLFSDYGLPKSLLASVLGLSSTTEAPIEVMLGEGVARLLVLRDSGYRIMHQLIAEEVLNWIYSTTEEGWQYHLQQLALRFIETVSRYAGAGSEFTLNLFRTIFIDRQGGYVDDVKDRQKFSPIIEDLDRIVNPTHGHQIFKKLTDECPDHSHFWMHRGRHHIYRLRGDAGVAEIYLERAVSLASSDPVIHHAYGLVIRYRVQEMLRLARNRDVRDILDEVLPFYRKAAEQFTLARELDPENMHGYVTHIQMNVSVCGAIKKLTGMKSIAQIRFTSYADLAEFTEGAMVEAQALLRNVSALYSTLTTSQARYVVVCSKAIRILYNDYDEAIRLLERADAGGAGGAYVRRSLANAYLGRRERKWSALSGVEIKRVAELMKKNLDGPDHQDDDYRLWFEAYRMLPDFDPVTALDRLSVWSLKTSSWRPYYYLYVLTFVRWLNGDIVSLEEMEKFVSQSKDRLIGRRTNSDFWLGRRFGKWALVHESELGEWDKDNKDRYKRFWKDPSPLAFKNGQIDSRIDGPQASKIVIEGVVKAFFVPGRAFSANRDEGKLVHFYMGFSPEGLRAWSVEYGHVAGGNRLRETERVFSAVEPYDSISDADKMMQAIALQKARVVGFIEDIVAAGASRDAVLGAEEVSARVDAAFGFRDVFRSLGCASPRDLIMLARNVRIRDTSDGAVVGLVASSQSNSTADRVDKFAGYIEKTYETSGTVRVRIENGNIYIAPSSTVKLRQAGSVTVMSPAVVTIATSGGRGVVQRIDLVEDRVFFEGIGLVAAQDLMELLCKRFVAYSWAQPNEQQFLYGVVPVKRCYDLLNVEGFSQLFSKVVQGSASLRASVHKGQGAGALNVDIGRLSGSSSRQEISRKKRGRHGGRADGESGRSDENRELRELCDEIVGIVSEFPVDGVELSDLGNRLAAIDPHWKSRVKGTKLKKLISVVQLSDELEVVKSGEGQRVRVLRST